MQRQVLSVALATAFVSAGLSVPSAQAVPIDEFDAPLLGTTATEQLTRMPTLDQVRCSDAACSSGLFPQTAVSLVEYSTPAIMPDAGYTRVPEFRRGVNVVWSDLTVRKGDTSFATFTIAEYQPGSNINAIMDSIAAQTRTPLTKSVVQGVTVFSGEVVNESDDENDFSGTSFKSAYVLGTNSFVRAGCQAGESGVQSSRCTVANLIPLAISMAQAQPQSAISQSGALTRLAPTSLPSSLQPLVVASVSDDQPWATDVTNKKLLAALNGQATAVAQYTIEGSPRMYVGTLTTKLDAPELARGYLNRACTVYAEEDMCTTRKLPGGNGVVTTYTRGSRDEAVVLVSIRGLTRNGLVEFSCFKREAVSGYLTKREIAQCSALARGVLNQARN